MNDTPVPSFKSPPLNEVVLGIQFEPIERFDITTYGSYWETLRSKFPRVEHHAPLDPFFEKIGGRKQALGEVGRIKFEPFLSAQLPRAWFISQDEQHLIQLQADRFLRNWRKSSPEDLYPRYENHLKPEFKSELKQFKSYCDENGLGKISVNQCEITYINHVITDKHHNQLGDVFVGWSNDYNLSGLAEIESINLSVSHIINDSDGDFIGRLYVKVQPVFRVVDDKPVILIELSVRGRPIGKDMDGVMKFMDMGREIIVRSFAKITTKEMHKLWGRER